MMKIFKPFHRFAAIVVAIAMVVWVATGEFSSVGSAQAAPEETASGSAPQADPHDALKTVAYVTPVLSDHARAIVVPGETAPDKRVTLVARSSGIIAKLNVTQGQHVEQDQVLASLEGADILAAVHTAETLLQQRQREAEAAEKLFKRGDYPQLQLDAARSALAQAQSQLEQAQSGADRLNVVAPFGGIMDDVIAEQGSWVQPGAEIGTLLSLDPMVITCDISEIDVGIIRVGSQADIRLADGQKVSGKIRYIGNEASRQTRTYPVEIEVPNPQGAIRSGMTAEVTLRAPALPAANLPASAVILSADGALAVRVVDQGGIAASLPIQVLDENRDGLIVTGLSKDSRVIVSGQDLVKNGERVNAVISKGAGAQ